MTGIIKFTRGVPKTQLEWERLFRPLNEVIQDTPDGVTIESDSIPSSDAPYVTTTPVSGLSSSRQFVSRDGETVVVESGATVEVQLADVGVAGTFTKVVTDNKGRVVAGAALQTSDMPATLQRIFSGIGSPNGVVVATPGALYLNQSGGAGTTLYIKETGSSNTGWRAV